MKTYIVRYHVVAEFSHGYLYKSIQAKNEAEARKAFDAWDEWQRYVIEKVFEDGTPVPDDLRDENPPRSCIGCDCPGTEFRKAILAQIEAERKKWSR